MYPHRGIDVQGGIGDPVKAPTSGTVTLGPKGDVVISTSDQEGNVYHTVLAHVDHDLKPGKKGTKVNAGDLVGTVQDPAKYITKGNPKDMTPHAHLGLYLDPKGDRNKRKVLDSNDHLATRLYDRDRNHRPVPLNGKIAR
ncbi:MAG: M23 family metallopeptidase [Thermodesulfobacteriota bacterium]